MIWDWEYAIDVLPALAEASLVTLAATFWGFFFALIIGLVLALLRRSQIWLIRASTGFFVEFVRSTPLLVQLYLLYFGLPQIGITMTPFTVGVIGLAVHVGAYISEVYRAGLDNVPAGQLEAATALNFDSYRRMMFIILPQAIPPIIPALDNYLVLMFKDTSLLSAIAVVEMLQLAKILGSESFRFLEPMTIVGVFFIVMSLLAASGIRYVEARVGRGST
ncbi:MAG: ectoine/hydroxyectoine ABC transporter permease subunit EhuD [Pseudomonadota bacterium]